MVGAEGILRRVRADSVTALEVKSLAPRIHRAAKDTTARLAQERSEAGVAGMCCVEEQGFITDLSA